MRAITIARQGRPVAANIVVDDDFPDPVAGAGDVLVRTEASAFNHLDLWVGAGLPGIDRPFPRISGSDGVGRVEAVGEGVDEGWIGRRVVLNAAMPIDETPRPDASPAPRDLAMIGEHVHGTLAERFVAPAANVLALSGDDDPVAAAAYALSHLTAWRMLDRARLRAGQWVLIPGIGGGVALAVLGLARHLGCRTIVTSRHAWKLERAAALGADHGVLDAGEDWSRAVRGFTGKRGVDVCADSVGKAIHMSCVKSLARGGTFVTCGCTTGPDATTDLARVFWNQLTIIGSTMGTMDEFRESTALHRAGLQPVIDSVHKPEEAAGAYARLESGEQFGKVVVDWEVEGVSGLGSWPLPALHPIPPARPRLYSGVLPSREPPMIRTPSAAEPDAVSSPVDQHVRRRIAEVIDERFDRLVRFRRRIHATPEASENEVATTALVAETLRENGLEPRLGSGSVGIVADIDLGANSDTFIAMRCELDAVDVNDDKQVPYASTRPGLCHACGHDAHSTIMVGAAVTLHELREAMTGMHFRHNLRFIFQPAEEKATGARSMIQQGAIDGVEAILALHVDPFLETGVVGLRPGAITSACKSFRITIRGRSGHSARPFEAVDPIPAAINLVSLLYQLAPRSIDARSPLVLTITAISSPVSYNAIPDEAYVCGTLRTARTEDTDTVQTKMDDIVRGLAEATGCDMQLEFLHSCPPTDNDPHLVEMLASVASDMLGPESVRWLKEPSLGAEDFGFFQELIPGVMVRLGAALPDIRQRRPLHSSLFDINEQALSCGARFMAAAAVRAAGR